MQPIIRNFLHVLKRFKVATSLNIGGLAVAFAAFIIILMQVNFEENFDKCHSTSNRIFRVDLEGGGLFSVILPRGFIEEVLVSSPHIESGTLLGSFGHPVYLTYMDDGIKKGYLEVITTCHPELISIFDFPIIEGDARCLQEPDKIIIPASMARKLFGDQSAVGKALHAEEEIWTKNRTDLTVGAVYKDFPENTQLRNVIYTAVDPTFARNNFEASNFVCYLLLDNAASAKLVADNFNKNFNFSTIKKPEAQIKLVPLTDIYYLNENFDAKLSRSGNKEITLLLFFIALLVILVAVINYINFSTALTPTRIKSINTQKVLGSSDSTLRKALITESVFCSMVAWLLSLLIVWGLGKTAMLSFVNADLSLVTNGKLVLMSGILAGIAGLIAGLYPAWYMVSFPPALVLKGSFGLSTSGRKLRTSLIGIQFVIAIMLIIGAALIKQQTDYMRNFSLGFDKDQIAIVKLSSDIYSRHYETFANRLKEYPSIEDVAYAAEKVAGQESYNTSSTTFKDKKMQYFMLPVSANFFQVMGIGIEEGRAFSQADELSQEPSYIFNRSPHIQMEMELGDHFESWISGRIIGFTGDIKFTSLRQGENNIGFVVGGNLSQYPKPYSYIRLTAGSDLYGAIDHIRQTLQNIDPSYPFDIEFYDIVFDQFYRKEADLRNLITLFSLLAIILSLVGVFGLVVFDTQYKQKEIAIRKVHGSSIHEILGRINKQYVYIICICFVIASPLAWYGTGKWLESFAYKTPVHWWIYLAALLIVLVITMATVTFQSWKAATANPVNSLKNE